MAIFCFIASDHWSISHRFFLFVLSFVFTSRVWLGKREIYESSPASSTLALILSIWRIQRASSTAERVAREGKGPSPKHPPMLPLCFHHWILRLFHPRCQARVLLLPKARHPPRFQPRVPLLLWVRCPHWFHPMGPRSFHQTFRPWFHLLLLRGQKVRKEARVFSMQRRGNNDADDHLTIVPKEERTFPIFLSDIECEQLGFLNRAVLNLFRWY